MTTEQALPPFYDHLIENLEKALAAGQLVGLQEELKTLRTYVHEYSEKHREEFEKIVRGMRLIMQMVLAQHRIGGDQLAQTIAAIEAATREWREQMLPPEVEDV